MELSSRRADTLNLPSSEGASTTINTNLPGTPDNKNPHSEPFSLVLESERPDARSEATSVDTTKELVDAGKTALPSPNTVGENTTAVDPLSPEKSRITTLAVDSDALNDSPGFTDDVLATSGTKAMTHAEASIDTATDELTMLAENENVAADNLPEIDVEDQFVGTVGPVVDNEWMSAVHLSEARTTPTASSAQETQPAATKTTIAQHALQPQVSVTDLKPATAYSGGISPALAGSTPVELLDSTTAGATNTPTLANTKPGNNSDPVQVPLAITNTSQEMKSGSASELLKVSSGVGNRWISLDATQAAKASAASASVVGPDLSNPAVVTASRVSPQSVPELTISPTTTGNWQQLETVGRLRTQLHQPTTQVTTQVAAQATTPATTQATTQSATTPITTVSDVSVVEAGKTPGTEKPVLNSSPVSDRTGLPLEANRPITSNAQHDVEPTNRTAMETRVKTDVKRHLTDGTALALNQPISTDARPAPISAGEFMIAQTVTSTGANTPANLSLEGLPRSTGALDLQESLMPEKLGNQIRIMADGRIQSATLQVKPADLGPIQISVLSENDKLTVNILASNVMTRDLLDTALPRLREQLSQGQFSQVDVNVSEQGKGQQQHSPSYEQNASYYQAEHDVAQQEEQSAGEDSDTGAQADSAAPARTVVVPDGRIDAYI